MKPELRLIGEICDVQKGTSITKEKVTDGKIPVIAGGQQPAYFHNVSNRKGKVITISASGAYAGFVNFFESPIFASDCTTIQSKDENKVSTKYVYLMIKSRQEEIYSLQTGAGQPHVYAKDLVKIRIPLPSLTIQQQIVAILERAERLKEMRQQANEETGSIVQSIFYEMFGDPLTNPKEWAVMTIRDIALNAKGSIRMGPFGSQLKKNELVDEGIRVLWIENIVNNRFDYKVGRFITEEKYEQLKGFTVHPGNILVTMMGTIGRVAIVPEDIKEAIISSHLLKIENDEKKCNSTFLKHMVLSNFVQDQFNNASHGIVMSGLNTKIVGNTRIILPPIELQNQFASYVERIESLSKKQEYSTLEIGNLSDALMQKAFSGELVT